MSLYQSEKLMSLYNAPGVFACDNPSIRPPQQGRKSTEHFRDKSSKTSQSALNSVRSTDSFFLPGTYDFKGDLENTTDQVWHMYHGKRQAEELGTDKVDKYNKMNAWWGWQKLFSSVEHDPWRGGGSNNNNPTHGSSTWNYQYYTNNMEQREQGILLGNSNIATNLDSTARWVSPVGIQFKWHNYHNHNLGSRMIMYNLWLIYTDIWCPSRALYAPIIHNGTFTNPNSFTRGVDLLGRSEADQEKIADYHYSGEVVGLVDEESMSVIRDKYTISACIGIAHRDKITAYNSAKYPKYRSLWDVSFLYTDEPKGSEIIIPEPHNLRERLEDRKVKLIGLS